MAARTIACSPIQLHHHHVAWKIPLRPSLETLIVTTPEEIPDWAMTFIVPLYRTCAGSRPEQAQSMLQGGWVVMSPRGYRAFYSQEQFELHFLEVSDGS